MIVESTMGTNKRGERRSRNKWSRPIPSCLACAGKDSALVRVERLDERAIPVSVADCCFMDERDDDEANARCMPILVKKLYVDK